MSSDDRLTQRSDWLRGVLFRVAGPLCRRLFRCAPKATSICRGGAAWRSSPRTTPRLPPPWLLAVPRPLSFVGKAEYLESWKTRRLFPALGMIPIDRDSPLGVRALRSRPGCSRLTSCSRSTRKALARQTERCTRATTASAI